ncbi:enoyl-[acyl-carrier-protein] reductase, mitochondrial-like [Selaginella moellendorffii]|uniref:enoyl-[acyl-carrier-protein] reductase, mitochondrial-like n=1 Tax=Selaginella moellendorffii TaxID=88036 RepID=UPI000D1C4280|nr:enoyl-[acyl-carrier-protein] reductase, mitochondrial-like [Selaginella moellendorffii]|eukprot:XP_024524245.1 enoyl-[acyl-carrier-protein] reductase, mitochondrial-like [Selaginella moellendorffii]
MTIEEGSSRVVGLMDRGLNKVSVCQVATVQTPKPGPDEVLLKILCRPVNPSDVVSLMGIYPGDYKFPYVPGFEGMGTIHERVFHTGHGGTWQEFMVTSPRNLTLVPDSISDEVAAQYYVNPWTDCGRICPWENVYPNRSSPRHQGDLCSSFETAGDFSSSIQQTINLVRRNEQKEELKALGADVVINFKEENVLKIVRELVSTTVRDEGTILVYGLLDGEDISANPPDVIFRHVRVRGFHLTRWIAKIGVPEQKKLGAKIWELLEKKVITPLTGEKLPLEKIQEAIVKSQVREEFLPLRLRNNSPKLMNKIIPSSCRHQREVERFS